MPSNEPQGESRTESNRAGVRAIIERYQNEPDQCTIFPEDADDEQRLTTWITAKEPFYVDSWEHR